MNCRNLLKHAKSNLFRESEVVKRSFSQLFLCYRNWEFLEQRQAKCLGEFNFLQSYDVNRLVKPASEKCRLNVFVCVKLSLKVHLVALLMIQYPMADSVVFLTMTGNTRLEACCSHKLVQFSPLAQFLFFRFLGQLLTRGRVMWFHIYKTKTGVLKTSR